MNATIISDTWSQQKGESFWDHSIQWNPERHDFWLQKGWRRPWVSINIESQNIHCLCSAPSAMVCGTMRTERRSVTMRQWYKEKFLKIKTKNKQNIKAKQIASNLSSCDASVVAACTLLMDGYESTIAVRKYKCQCAIFWCFFLFKSCLVDYEAYVDASKVCEKETVADCRWRKSLRQNWVFPSVMPSSLFNIYKLNCT